MYSTGHQQYSRTRMASSASTLSKCFDGGQQSKTNPTTFGVMIELNVDFRLMAKWS